MPITLDQARALQALAEYGTFEAAASALHKGHSAIVYAIKNMEAQLELKLLDRQGYRTKVTPAGERVLEASRKLLSAERELESACTELRTGWEPRVRIVFDGIFPADPILRVVQELALAKAKTRIEVSTAFLASVEESFLKNSAEMMISVVPVSTAGLRITKLESLRAILVAHKTHPLAQGKGRKERSDLDKQVLLTVRGSDPRLELSTSVLEPSFSVELNDFQAKKTAILSKMGFGWLPEYLISSELRSGLLREVRWEGASVQAIAPKLYHRASPRLGRAGQLFATRLSP